MTASGVSKNFYCFTWCRYRLRRLCRLSTCENATSSWRITLITEPIKNKWRKRKRKLITNYYLWKYKQDVSQQISSSFLLRFLKVFSEVWRQNGLENNLIGKSEQLHSPASHRNVTFSTYYTYQIQIQKVKIFKNLSVFLHSMVNLSPQMMYQRCWVQNQGVLCKCLCNGNFWIRNLTTDLSAIFIEPA